MVNEFRGLEPPIYVGFSCLFTQILAKAGRSPRQQLYQTLLRFQHPRLLNLKTTSSLSLQEAPFVTNVQYATPSL